MFRKDNIVSELEQEEARLLLEATQQGGRSDTDGAYSSVGTLEGPNKEYIAPDPVSD